MSSTTKFNVSKESRTSRTQNMQIAYQNKDIISKIFTEGFGHRSLEAYGIKVPQIVELLPTNFPAIEANELRIDNLLLLEDGTIAIIDYESEYKDKDKIKYLGYLIRVLQKQWMPEEKPPALRMIVIYTADVTEKQVDQVLNAGAVKMTIDAAYLSELDPGQIWANLVSKIDCRQILSEKEIMLFIIFPLAYKTKEEKKKALKKAISLAKRIEDRDTARFIISGLTVFCDKIIDQETANDVRRWVEMTQVGRLFEEEKEKAIKEAVKNAEDRAATAEDRAASAEDRAATAEDRAEKAEAKLREYERKYGKLA